MADRTLAKDQVLTADEEAVMRVIAAESASYYQKDFASFERCWAHEPYIRRMGWYTEGGVTDTWGWTNLKRLTLQHFQENPEIIRFVGRLRRENLVVQVSGDMAYATFDEYTPDATDPHPEEPIPGRGARVLRFLDGQWRITFHSYIFHRPEPSLAPMLRLGSDGAVRNMNSPAARLIARGDVLSVRGGQLIATNDRATRSLRAAIRIVAQSDDAIDGPRARIPILLSQNDDDAVCVCWVLTEGAGSGSVLVLLNNLTFAIEKIDSAAALFGLSPSQRRLAELIATGHDIVVCSGLLDISVNTAKTHLQRIFDKTGVRSQSALVRTLLSIERPE